MITPTSDLGAPALKTTDSIKGASDFPSNTTAASEIINNMPLKIATFRIGGAACVSSPTASTGRKKSRCLTVCTNIKVPYNTTDMSETNMSWLLLYSGPGFDTV